MFKTNGDKALKKDAIPYNPFRDKALKIIKKQKTIDKS